MNTDAIDKAFREMIEQRAIGKKIGEEANYVAQLRFKLKNGIGISTDTKLRLLQKSGWKQKGDSYSKQDLISFAKAWHNATDAARAHGIEYVFEKWEIKRK